MKKDILSATSFSKNPTNFQTLSPKVPDRYKAISSSQCGNKNNTQTHNGSPEAIWPTVLWCIRFPISVATGT